jgi:hypothetical protein
MDIPGYSGDMILNSNQKMHRMKLVIFMLYPLTAILRLQKGFDYDVRS